jgi:hypothetical protein
MEGEDEGGASSQAARGKAQGDASGSYELLAPIDVPGKDLEPTPSRNAVRAQAFRSGNSPADKPSYRELQRQAYSHESLHQFKSGRGGKSLHGARDASRGGGRGRGSGRGRGNNSRGTGGGRGQPDMRLRMNAMLEKIKHSVSEK